MICCLYFQLGGIGPASTCVVEVVSEISATETILTIQNKSKIKTGHVKLLRLGQEEAKAEGRGMTLDA